MTIEFRCDCGELFQVEDELAGRKGRCPTCKRIMVVPEKEPEPLDLQDEIQEQEEEFPDMIPASDVPQPLSEPPTGARVEEEVEVLRGWDGPEPDLERMESSVSKRPVAIWSGIPRPLLLGVPAAVVGVLILFFLLRPSSQRSEHPALDRAPSASMSEKLSSSPKPQAEPPSTQPSPAPPAVEPPKQEAPPIPPAASRAQPEKSVSAKQAPSAASKEEEKRATSSSSTPTAAAPAKPPVSSKETKPKQTPAQPPQVASAARASSPASENYTVNVGAFKSQGMADAYAEVLRKRGLEPFVWSTELTKGQGKMYRVSIGRFPTKRQADLYAKELKEKHGLNTYVAKKPGS